MNFCEGASIRTDDEGQAVTITLLASSEEWYALLCETLSAERLQEALSPLGVEGAVRAETPGILALRFDELGLVVEHDAEPVLWA